MKARYNVTGEVVDIEDMSIVTYKESDGTYVKTLIKNFTFIDAEKDYYTKLEHQYAGMAMQGMMSGWWSESIANIAKSDKEHFDILVHKANELAHALVGKLKEE
jgi:ferritin-like protein